MIPISRLLCERHGLWFEAGIGDRFAGCGDAKRDDARDVLALMRVDPCEFVEVGDLARHVDGESGRIEARNAFDAGLPAHHAAAEVVFAQPERADHAHPRDHYARTCPSNTLPPSPSWAKWDNQCTHGARSVHLGPLLSHQVQLLQFCFGCVFPRRIRPVCGSRLRRSGASRIQAAKEVGGTLRARSRIPFISEAVPLVF